MKRTCLTAIVALLVALVAGPALADCDSTQGTSVQMQSGGDVLVICSDGTFDFRGYPSKASVTADTENPTDTATITVQLQQDDGDNLSSGSVLDVYVADTSTPGNGVTALNGGTGNGGVAQLTGDSGSILNERVTDALFTLETNGSGKATFQINDDRDTDRWIVAVMPTGELIRSPKIDFD